MWNYYRDELSNPLCSNSESFKYKTSITGKTYKVGADEANYDANKAGKNETEVVIPLKHLSNFWRSLNISLINCEVELILTWSKNCILADLSANVIVNMHQLHQPICTNWINIWNNIHQIVCFSCYFVKKIDIKLSE